MRDSRKLVAIVCPKRLLFRLQNKMVSDILVNAYSEAESRHRLFMHSFQMIRHLELFVKYNLKKLQKYSSVKF